MFYNFRNLNRLKVNHRQFANKMNYEKSMINRFDHTKVKVIGCMWSYAIDRAAEQLQASNVIALPTDTVYGLACSANDRMAIQKLYDIKGRNEEKPVAICVATIADLRHWGDAAHLSDDLLRQLLPGAVTIVLNRTEHLDNPFLNKGIAKIGIRIPDFEFIQRLCGVYGLPIALTSANRSGDKSTLRIDEFRGLWTQLGAVFDGGRMGQTEEQRAASTVVDLSRTGFYRITRNGVAAPHTIEVMEKHRIECDLS